MGFHIGSYATVWSVEDKGKFSNVNLSTSRKNKQSGNYETDFSDYVSFVGDAHKDASRLKARDRIKITGCDTTNRYDKERGQKFYNHTVFSFEFMSGNDRSGGQSGSKPQASNQLSSVPNITDDDPF